MNSAYAQRLSHGCVPYVRPHIWGVFSPSLPAFYIMLLTLLSYISPFFSLKKRLSLHVLDECRWIRLVIHEYYSDIPLIQHMLFVMMVVYQSAL